MDSEIGGMRKIPSALRKRYQAIGVRIGQALEAAELSQGDLGARIGVSQSLVALLIQGARTPDKYLGKIARVCRVPLSYFVDGEGWTPPQAAAEPLGIRAVALDATLLHAFRRGASVALEIPRSEVLNTIPRLPASAAKALNRKSVRAFLIIADS